MEAGPMLGLISDANENPWNVFWALELYPLPRDLEWNLFRRFPRFLISTFFADV